MDSEVETDPNSDPNSEIPGPETPPKDSGKSDKSGLSISELALKALNQITVMLARYRNTSVRERMAKLQEKKFELRCLEFEWKKSVHASKAEKNSAVRAPAASSPNSEVKEDDLARLERTLDAVERRTCETFNLPYDGPTKPEPSSSSPTLSQTSSEPLSNTNAAAQAELHAPTASSPQSAIPEPYLQSEKKSEPPSAPNSAVAALQSEIRAPQSEMAGPYLQTEKNLRAGTSPLPPLPPVEKSAINPQSQSRTSKAKKIRAWKPLRRHLLNQVLRLRVQLLPLLPLLPPVMRILFHLA